MARTFDDASSQYARMNLNIGSVAKMTFFLWLKFLDLTSRYQCLLNWTKGTANNRHGLLILNDNTIAFQNATNSAEAHAISSYGASVDGAWHSICGWNTANNARYVTVDGANQGTNTTNISVATGDFTDVCIAAQRIGSAIGTYAHATIAECAIWGVDLTAGERAALAAGFSPLMVRPASLFGYWPLHGVYSPEIGRAPISAGYAAVRDMTLYGGSTPPAAVHPRIIYPSPLYSSTYENEISAFGPLVGPSCLIAGGNPLVGPSSLVSG